MIKTYDIEIDCIACANKCECEIKKIDGVKDCKINFLMQKMTIDAERGDVIEECKRVAKKIEPDFEIIGTSL